MVVGSNSIFHSTCIFRVLFRLLLGLHCAVHDADMFTLLQVVGLEMTTEKVGTSTHSKTWREEY